MQQNKRGRTRPASTRGGRMGSRGPPPMQQAAIQREMLQGIYTDPRFTHVAAVLKGCTVHIQVKSGSIYEGILCTMSPQSEIVLEAAHMLDQPGDNAGKILNKIDFKAANIVSITAKDVDLDYAVKGNRDSLMTDSEIARRQNGQAGERELKEWQGAGVEGDDMSLETASEDVQHANGWSAEEMFKKNEASFGVTSSYDDALPQYTTSLDQSNPKVYQERKEMAEKLAREMEGNPSFSGAARPESDDITEEDKFSAVSRNSESSASRYIPPHMRDNTRVGPPQHASAPRRPQAPGPRMAGTGRPQMSSPHHAQPPPHPPTQAQSHPHAQAHPHQPMVQQVPGHMYQNMQTRLSHPGLHHQHQQQMSQSQQPLPPQQLQPPQHHVQPLQQPSLSQQQQQQQQQQQLKHAPVPQPQLHVHGGPRHPPPPHHLGQIPPRGQPPTQMPPCPPGLGSQSPRSSPLPHTDSSSPNVKEEKTHQIVSEDRQQVTDDGSSRKTESSPVDRTSDSTTVSPEKSHKNVQEKTFADLKEFRDTFNLEGKPSEEDATSIPSTNAAAPSEVKPGTTEKTTPTVPQVTEDREGKETETSSGKSSPSQSSKDKEKQLNPLAKVFVPTAAGAASGQLPQRGIPTKTPTPPRPQSYSPSPMVLQHPTQFTQSMGGPYILSSSAQGYQGAFPMPQQAVAQAQAQATHMGPKQMMQKKGYPFAGAATNIPHQRPQPPTDLPTHVIPVSVAAGQPLVSPMGFQHHPSQMIHYQPQQGMPGQIAGQQMIPQPTPYQIYPQKHAVPFRQMQPQPSIQGVPQPQGAPHIHQLQEGSIQGTSPVLVANTQLPAQAGQVQQQMHTQFQHQQQQQQQVQQQQQQQHAQQQTQQPQQQQPQPQHHHHPQQVVHLQPQQHQHPHAQPHTTPPQQQSHGSQPSPMAQQQQQQQQQQTQQQQQQQHRPTPSPVHHMPHPQHQGHQPPHVSQPQPIPHHLHPQAPHILYHPSSMQHGHLPLAVQSSQAQQQFGGPHQYVPQQYITATTLPATNITSVTPVHSNPHPHPTQANVMFVQQGQPMNHMVHSSGQIPAHILPQTQGLGQAHGPVPTYQQGN